MIIPAPSNRFLAEGILRSGSWGAVWYSDRALSCPSGSPFPAFISCVPLAGRLNSGGPNFFERMVRHLHRKGSFGSRFSSDSVLSVDSNSFWIRFLIPFCLPEIPLASLVTGSPRGMLLVSPSLKQGSVVSSAPSRILVCLVSLWIHSRRRQFCMPSITTPLSIYDSCAQWDEPAGDGESYFSPLFLQVWGHSHTQQLALGHFGSYPVGNNRIVS